MSRYHINPETGNPGVCHALVKCPFGDLEKDHYETKEEARKAYEKRPKVTPRVPIILPPAKGLSPQQWDLSFYNLEEATDSEIFDYYDNEYSEPTSYDVNRIVEIVTGLTRDKWPKELKKLVSENLNSWSTVTNWSFEHGYYDDGPYLYAPLELEAKLREWYYAQPNAIDMNNILVHVREKGFDTTGLTPVEAVKKMLREENNKILGYVEKSTNVLKRNISFKEIAYAKVHYGKIEEREPVPLNPASETLIGVVKHHGEKYRLLDGHHRLKYAVGQGQTSGLFIILT